MKKRFIVLISIVVILFWCIYIFIQIKYGWQIWISRRIEILVPFSVVVEYKDSHSGFHGDGECLVKVFFSEEQSQKFKD